MDATKIIDKIEIFDDYLLNKTNSGATSANQLQPQQTQQTNACTNIVSIKSSYLKSLSYLVVSLTDAGTIIYLIRALLETKPNFYFVIKRHILLYVI